MFKPFNAYAVCLSLTKSEVTTLWQYKNVRIIISNKFYKLADVA